MQLPFPNLPTISNADNESTIALSIKRGGVNRKATNINEVNDQPRSRVLYQAWLRAYMVSVDRYADGSEYAASQLQLPHAYGVLGMCVRNIHTGGGVFHSGGGVGRFWRTWGTIVIARHVPRHPKLGVAESITMIRGVRTACFGESNSQPSMPSICSIRAQMLSRLLLACCLPLSGGPTQRPALVTSSSLALGFRGHRF